MAEEAGDTEELREQDRFLPIANISRIMKKSLPDNAKIAKDAKETVQVNGAGMLPVPRDGKPTTQPPTVMKLFVLSHCCRHVSAAERSLQVVAEGNALGRFTYRTS